MLARHPKRVNSELTPEEDLRPRRSSVVLIALVTGAVLAAQVPVAIGLLDPDVVFEAGHAKTTLLVNALLALATVLVAAFAPARLRALALVPGAAVFSAMLLASITVGGHLGDVLAASATVAAAWWLGRAAIRILGVRELGGIVVVELVLGLAALGLVTFALGRLGLIAWWSVGVLVVVVGLLGANAAGRMVWSRRGGLWGAIVGTPIGVACAGLLLLQAGWAIVWLSAPEIMYDAISTKAYLPEFWAQAGDIGPLLAHPILNTTGLAQIVAVPGHTLGAGDVGRDLQIIVLTVIVATVWWFGRRSVAGPLAALAVGLAPQLVWESTTAYDDLLIALGVVALVIAIVRTLGERGREQRFTTALTIGLLAGACVWLKLHVGVLTAMLALGWVLMAGPLPGAVRRLIGVVAGGLLVIGPSLIVRWIDTGNPVFPAYNNIFHSRYALPVNETFNFPFWPQAGLWGAIKLPYEAIVQPSLMVEVVPAGGFGLLVAALVLAVVLGWRQPERRPALILWAAIVVGLVVWWFQFRYLRYLIPMSLVAMLLVEMRLSAWRPGATTRAVLLVAVGLASAFYLPSTVAQYWNVPNRNVPYAAAFGRWDQEDYLNHVFFEKPVTEAFARLAPPGAMAISGTHLRLYLHDRDLTAGWEIKERMELSGPLTTAADTRARLRRLGVDWALLTDPDRGPGGPPWLHGVLARYGRVVFEKGAWTLFRLEDQPVHPRAPAG